MIKIVLRCNGENIGGLDGTKMELSIRLPYVTIVDPGPMKILHRFNYTGYKDSEGNMVYRPAGPVGLVV